jgi:hypothetical protein
MFLELTVNLGVTGVPQAVEATSPRSDPPRQSQKNEDCERDGESDYNECSEQELELLPRNEGADNFHEGDQLKQTEHA